MGFACHWQTETFYWHTPKNTPEITDIPTGVPQNGSMPPKFLSPKMMFLGRTKYFTFFIDVPADFPPIGAWPLLPI